MLNKEIKIVISLGSLLKVITVSVQIDTYLQSLDYKLDAIIVDKTLARI